MANDLTKKGSVRDIEGRLLGRAGPRLWKARGENGGSDLQPHDLTLDDALALRERMQAESIVAASTRQAQQEVELMTERQQVELEELRQKRRELEQGKTSEQQGYVDFLKETLDGMAARLDAMKDSAHQKDVEMAQRQVSELQDQLRQVREQAAAPQASGQESLTTGRQVVQVVEDIMAMKDALEKLAPPAPAALALPATEDPGVLLGFHRLHLEDQRERLRIEKTVESNAKVREKEIAVQHEQAAAERARAEGVSLLVKEALPVLREAVGGFLAGRGPTPSGAAPVEYAAPAAAQEQPVFIDLSCNSCGHEFQTSQREDNQYSCPQCATLGSE